MRLGGDSGNEGDRGVDRRSEDCGGSGPVDGDDGAAGLRYVIDRRQDEGQHEGNRPTQAGRSSARYATRSLRGA
jgi:hypothetical protein